MVVRGCRTMERVWRNAVVILGTIMWALSCGNCDTSENDVSALNVLYVSLNNPASLTNWVAIGGDPCAQQWFGVSCTGSDVTSIKLPGMGLTGTLGYNMQNMTALTELDVSNNNLGGNGPIPYNLPPNLERLNLGGNQFGGSLPYSISLIVRLQYLNIGHNQLQGNLTDIFGGLTNLTTLDLSFNSLTGDLPPSFSNLQSLTSLHLENNQFTGPIDVLANLPLQDLDVANNLFTGWIPDQLKKINNLQTAGNSWSNGPAPPPPPFTAPPPTRKIHPGHQSGDNNRHPSQSQSQSQSQSHSRSESNGGGIGAGVIAGIVISVLVVSIIIVFLLIRKKSQKKSKEEIFKKDNLFNPPASDEVKEFKVTQPPSAFDALSMLPSSLSLKPPPIERQKSLDEDDFGSKPITKKANRKAIKATVYSVADLQIATDSFSVDNLVGEGSFGHVYKAQFTDGKVLAVKKINNSALTNQSADEFLDLVSNLSNLHHPNLSELVGYCCEHGQYLLVYEFYKTGSLHDLLHLSDEYSKPLSWGARIKVALGTARALEYLHEVCSPSLVHKNLKSSNILLDAELSPHLSDYGLDSLTPDVDFVTSEQNTSAPEVAMSGQYTMKSDVYSFGTVMLELMTGRKTFDSTRPRSEQLLVRWAIPQLHDIDALDSMIDPTLKGLYPAKSLSRFADVIALCVQPEPEFRPPMSEVVQALVRLVQRANMSKRVLSGEGLERRNDDPEEYLL